MTGPLVRLVAATAVLTGAIAAAMAAPHNATSNPLRVSMYAADGSVEVIVTNTSRQVARVPKWQLPSSELQGNLFRISRDGQPVAYEGILAKRGLPQPSDFAILRPGQSYVVAFRADNPGIWMDHCHNLRHAADGLTMHIAYAGVTTPFMVGDTHRNTPE